MFQKTRALEGWGRAVSLVPGLCRPPGGAGDTRLLYPLGRSQDCPPLRPVQGPGSTGALGGTEGPTRLPAQDSEVHYSCPAGLWLQTAPGGGGSPVRAGAAGGSSRQAVCIRKSLPPG